jgi:acetolactate synthase-1/2/3 large subunit
MCAKMTGGRLIAETLKGYGVTHIFYVESVLRHALIDMQELGIQTILAHSEKAAAYMADGYARARRGPGVCAAQAVGAANLASGLQDAYLGNSPVIALTGRKPPFAQHRNAYQEIMHFPLFDKVTKFTATVEAVDQLPHLLRQAFREATSGSPGPVHLDLIGHQGQITETALCNIDTYFQNEFACCPSHRMEPDNERVKAAAKILMDAKKPVIVAGSGALISSAGPEIMELAERLSIPIATSVGAKGIIVETHPLCVGLVGSYSRWCANRTVAEADLVVFIGSGTGDQVTNNWTVPSPNTRILQIDIDPVELGRNYLNTFGLAGDAKLTVKKLLNYISLKRNDSEWAKHARQYVEQWLSEAQGHSTSDVIPIRPERVCTEITKILPEDAVLVSDTGHSAIWSGTLCTIRHASQRYLRCAGSLGWAFPASLGVKCALPKQHVICFTGDGGFFYHLPELETARRYNLKTITIVNNNSGLGQCLDQFAAQPGAVEGMFKFQEINFAKIAEDMGCIGIRVEDPNEISKALNLALESNLPVVVDLVTDIHAFPLKPWKPTNGKEVV